jgi:hypothetical protein
MCGDTLATEVTAWSTAVLTIVGAITLVDLGLTRRQRRKAVDLQIGRRAFRVRSMMRERLNDPALRATDNLTTWVEHVVKGEAEVERLLEEMVDLAVDASKDVQEATQTAYGLFMHAAELANKFGQHPHPSGQTNPRDQALAARAELERAEQNVSKAVPRVLNG